MNNDLDTLYSYYHKIRLHLSLEKTSNTLFHLYKHKTSRRLKIGLGKSTISYCKSKTLKCLRVILDRPLTYKQHFLSLHQKVLSRCALLSKHAGTTWGTFPHTLRTSALALVYSTAEYGTRVWSRSAYKKLSDISINSALRTITGCFKPTPAFHLALLACIAPAFIRVTQLSIKLAKKYSGPNYDLKHLLEHNATKRILGVPLRKQHPT